MAFPYLESVVGFMVLVYFFETYLDIRQHRSLKLPTLPKALLGIISQEKFEKSRAYSLDKSYFRFVHQAVDTVTSTAMLFFGMLPWFWEKSGEVVVYMGLNADNEIIHILSYLAGMMIWSQAYFYGFFKNKRIVLYDTLLEQCKNVDEIVGVIAHELGHWKLRHTLYSFVNAQILTFLQFGGFALVRNSKDLFQSFGFQVQPVIIGLTIFQYTITPIDHVVSFGLNLVSRAFEFQADAFAKKLGFAKPLRSALVKLQEENLSSMNTDPWYSAYHYSHPPLVERLEAMDESADTKKED